MLNNQDKAIIRELRAEVKFMYLEEIIKGFMTELLDQRDETLRLREEEKKPLLTIVDIAKRFKVTKATIHNWMNRGAISGSKVGKNRYFTEDEVKGALAKYGFTKQWDDDLAN